MEKNSKILKKIYRRKGEIVSRKIAGETILVPVKGKLADMQRIFSLNPVGEYIWRQLDGERDLQEIVNSIHLSFNVDRKQADTDLREFIGELASEGLITGEN